MKKVLYGNIMLTAKLYKNMNNNDKKILELQKEIGQQRADLGGYPSLKAKTSLVIRLLNYSINLNTLVEAELKVLLAWLSTLNKEHQTLFNSDLVLEYPIEDIFHDINGKIELLKYKTKKSKLDSLEHKLSTLLSQDLKTSQELDNIVNMLHNGT